MRIAIIGASGGIGHAFCEALIDTAGVEQVYAVSRSGRVISHDVMTPVSIDILNEDSIKAAADVIKADGKLDGVIVATGILSDEGTGLTPEKSWRDQSMAGFTQTFEVNTFGPALVAKHFLPLLARKQRVVFAALSARVGSICDNRLGGWHAYRASKAALNMLVRNYALEMARRNDQAICVSLHPGTVQTDLSEKFVAGSDHDVFTPDKSARYLLKVIAGLTPDDSGKAFDWDGKEIPA